VAFVISFGALLLKYFIIHGDLLGRVLLDNRIGYGVSGLLVLTSMAIFIVARVVQLIAQALTNRRNPHV